MFTKARISLSWYNGGMDLTEPVLRKLYLVELKTESEIAHEFGTYQVAVNRLRKKWGIPTVGKTGRISQTLPPLTDRQRELLVGSLLGDGSLVEKSPSTALYRENHSPSQLPYLEWKHNILAPYSNDVFEVVKRDRKTGKKYVGYDFNTKSCEALRPLYDLFYPDGKRVFPASLPDLMTPFVLAVWYMDDGNAQNGHPRIAFGLDDVSLKRALAALGRLGLEAKVRGNGSRREIAFPGQRAKFFRVVGEHIHESMLYKMPPETLRMAKDENASRLTPENARRLVEGGMTYRQVADLYGVGASTVRRKAVKAGAGPKTPGPVHKPRRTRTEIDSSLSGFDPKEWGNLPDDTKEKWVEEALKMLREVSFPYPERVEGPPALAELDKLEALNTPISSEGRVGTLSPVGISLCNGYFPNRFRASWKRTRTAFERWHSDEDLRSALRFQWGVGDPVLPHRILRVLTLRARTPTIFRPSVAKAIYQAFCPRGGTVWDPCSGYGGRLLGALAARVTYFGTDVEPETVEGNNLLAKNLGKEGHAEVTLCPAESYTPPDNLDLVFTSPPYFRTELYGASEDQSFLKYGDLGSWVDGFLRPIVRMSRKKLKDGGRLVLNVADVRERRGKEIPLVQATIDAATEEGFVLEQTLGMPLAKLNRKEAWEPVLVFIPTYH